MTLNVAIVTGSRADYGLLSSLIKKIHLDPDYNLQLIVTAMHLALEFGMTKKEIESDGYTIAEEVEILLASDTPSGISKSLGLTTIAFADCFKRLKPDFLIVLGDRFEILGVVQAAFIAQIPVVHIHGGESTQGAIDEGVRHCITKMSHLHFTTTEVYRRRVIQLGESPKTVFFVGAPVADQLKGGHFLSKSALEEKLKVSLSEKFFLITLHPETLVSNNSEKIADIFLEALDFFKDYQLIFTKTTGDTYGRVLNQKIQQYVDSLSPGRAFLFDSVGHKNYLSLINLCSLMVGNSSSGLIEASLMKKPCINIGIRQLARVRPDSVIDAEWTVDSIKKNITLGLSEKHQETIKNMVNPYGEGNVADKIVSQLKKTDMPSLILKKFYDLSFSE